MPKKGTVKQQLFDRCNQLITERIVVYQTAIESANTAINEDSKSSAGDKYETSREMITQEIKNNSTHLAEAVKQKQLLSQIDVIKVFDTIQTGSLVFTNHETFFISISAGTLLLGSQNYQCISPSSPLGRNFIDKKKGDKVVFNAKVYLILMIE